MKKIALLVMAAVLVGCGGGDTVSSPRLTSPSADLVGTYRLIGSMGDMEIGATQIYTHALTYPPFWSNGTYDYVVESFSQGEYIRAKVGTFTVFTANITTDNSMTMTLWRQQNNVVYEMQWEKISDSTDLN